MEILLIDDDPDVRSTLVSALATAGHELSVAADGNEGMRKLRAAAYDLVIADVHHPGPDGFTILQYVRSTAHQTDVVLMTCHGAVADAVAAMKQRATDYLVKPVTPDELVCRTNQIAERRAINARERAPAQQDTPIATSLIGASAEMSHVRSQIRAMGPSEASVLVTGESGTGKELVARALHDTSPRNAGPFVAINCAAFPEALLEAELFGHERGAFTGADHKREGRLRAAQKGTLFLDEIGEMNPRCQVKLLRVLQEREFSPLGTNAVFPLDVRIVSATNRPLKQLIEQGRFRGDLLYRIKVLSIALPPLRQREGDLALLTAHFLGKFASACVDLRLASDTWALLRQYPFPGNVRELEHAVEHAVVMARAERADEIRPAHLPSDITEATRRRFARGTDQFRKLPDAVHDFERRYLLEALSHCQGNRTRAAMLLGISRKNLWEKMRARGITDSDIDGNQSRPPKTGRTDPR